MISASLEKYAARALETASGIELKEKSSVVSYPRKKEHFTTPLIRNPDEISIDEKFNLIRGYNEILKSSEKVQSTRAIYRDSRVQYVFVNTEGTELCYDRSYCGIALTSITRDGNVIQPLRQFNLGIRRI